MGLLSGWGCSEWAGPIAPLQEKQYVDAIWWVTERGCGPRIVCPPRPEGNWGEVHEQDG